MLPVVLLIVHIAPVIETLLMKYILKLKLGLFKFIEIWFVFTMEMYFRSKLNLEINRTF